MSISAYLLSFLRKDWQRDLEGFCVRHSASWLIWEPGRWRPTKSFRTSDRASTVDLRGMNLEARPVGMDAFCFRLEGTQELRLGRASDADILVNDVTLSRTHVLLRAQGREWEACVAPQCNQPTQLGDAASEPGVWKALRSGMIIQGGEVRFTYYDFPGMLQRIAYEAAKSAA
ncbi:MAG: hypothetical protein QM817_04095 [Archangium sp.]